jgi:hypothetical protein
VPTTETVQVLVLSSFFQLILCLLCHWALPFMPEAEYTMLTWYLGIVIGVLGACFQSGFNRWVRGESLSLRAALAVDKINKKPGESDGWCDEEREYRCVYEAGSDRALGQLMTGNRATWRWRGVMVSSTSRTTSLTTRRRKGMRASSPHT